MASHLDLEEQEQLADLKHFWNKYGNLITWLAIVVFGAIGAWNGWVWWQNRQGAQASALHAELERAAQAGEVDRVQRALQDLREQYGSTTYAQQGSLLAAQTLAQAGKSDDAQAALRWVTDKGGDAGYQAVARLRLAGLLADAKKYDEALALVTGKLPAEFAGLAADRRGDILQLQGKKPEALAAYREALTGLDDRADYRRLVEVKLAALGGEPPAAASSVGGVSR